MNTENMQHFAKVEVWSMLSTTCWSCDCESFWAHAACRSRGMWVYLVGVLYLTNLQSWVATVNTNKGGSPCQICLHISMWTLNASRTPLSLRKCLNVKCQPICSYISFACLPATFSALQKNVRDTSAISRNLTSFRLGEQVLVCYLWWG